MRTREPELKRKRKKENRTLSWHVVDTNTAWLNAECIWQDNRICFVHQNSVVVPSPSALAKAQRQLYSLSEKGEFKKNIDVDDWREHRLAKLEIAKLLSSITLTRPFDETLASAKRGSEIELLQLCQLLVAESVVLSDLPFSASKSLAALGDQSCVSLHVLALKTELPSNARRLAALVLGANLKQSHDRKFSASTFSFPDEELRRCFYWGLKHGCTGDDAFFARILQDREGLDLAGRVCVARSRLKHLSITSALASKMLFSGIETNRLVELIEGLAAMEPLYVEMYRQQFDDHKNFSWNKSEREERQIFATQWKHQFFDVLSFCLDTRALVAMTSLSQWILSNYRPDSHHARVFRDILNTAGFTPSLFASYLRILDVHSQEIFPILKKKGVEKRDRLRYCWEIFAFPIRTLLLSTQDPLLVENIISAQSAVVSSFAEVDWQDANELRQAWRIYQKYAAPTSRSSGGNVPVTANSGSALVSGSELVEPAPLLNPIAIDLPAIHKFFARSSDLSKASGLVDELISIEQRLCNPVDGATLRYPLILNYFSARKNGPRELEALMPEIVQKFMPVTQMCCGQNRIEELTFLPSLVDDSPSQWLSWFYDELERQKIDRHTLGCMDRDILRAGFMLSVALSGGNFERMKVLFFRTESLSLPEPYLFNAESMGWLNSMPALAFALRIMLCNQSTRAISLLQNMLLIHHVCREQLNTLRELPPLHEDWMEMPFGGAASRASAWSLDEGAFECWRLVCVQKPEIARLASAFFASSKTPNCVLPKSIARELDYRERLIREKAYLESWIASGSSKVSLQKRIENIDARLADPETHISFMADRIQEKLEYHLAEQIFLRSEAIVLSAFNRRISDFIGFDPKIDSFDDDLFYAALLWLELTCNKVLLKKLLKARMQNNADWIMRQPANKNYFLSMQALGLDVDAWLSESSVTFAAPYAQGGKVRLYMERDALKVLRMGHYFNTCLKFGGVNSFSAVTNAVDINKRVIYACDASGKILARKLICIADEKTLLGYNLYFPTPVDDNYEHLQAIFKQYCQAIALKVGLELGDEGEPKLLCAEDWYDDSPVSWERRQSNAEVAADAANIAADIIAQCSSTGR